MTAEVELLPLPRSLDSWFAYKMEEYALANVEHHTTALQAEVEALRAEVDALKAENDRLMAAINRCQGGSLIACCISF